jgi:hypothetical protein
MLLHKLYRRCAFAPFDTALFNSVSKPLLTPLLCCLGQPCKRPVATRFLWHTESSIQAAKPVPGQS